MSFDIHVHLNDDPFLLAPMAGVTCSIYRKMAYRHGCSLAYSEMVSVAGLAHASAKTWDLVDPDEDEPPIAIQLFGSKPEQFGSAVEAVIERLGSRLSLIDINMACPVPKVFKKGEGCALMDSPDIACKCVREAVAGAAGVVPITVKMRSGVRSGEVTAPSFAKNVVRAGASCVAVHGRSAADLYRGHADWNVITSVVSTVDAPVIGSGDVLSAEAANEMLTRCGCSGVFIARGSYGNPWIFEQAYALHAGASTYVHPSPLERIEELRTHVDWYLVKNRHLSRLRSIIGWYVKGLPSASLWRGRAMECVYASDYRALLDQMKQSCIDHGMV